MAKFSNDVDVLKYEPALFGELHLPSQVQTSGNGAVLNGTTLTASQADFIKSSVEAGGVVHLRSADGSLDGAYEIVSVDSATQLTVSVVRADPTTPPARSGPTTSLRSKVFAGPRRSWSSPTSTQRGRDKAKASASQTRASTTSSSSRKPGSDAA